MFHRQVVVMLPPELTRDLQHTSTLVSQQEEIGIAENQALTGLSRTAFSPTMSA